MVMTMEKLRSISVGNDTVHSDIKQRISKVVARFASGDDLRYREVEKEDGNHHVQQFAYHVGEFRVLCSTVITKTDADLVQYYYLISITGSEEFKSDIVQPLLQYGFQSASEHNNVLKMVEYGSMQLLKCKLKGIN